MELKINPEYEKVLPKLTELELKGLKADIKENGLLTEIIVNKEGIILDGHNRFKICKELGITSRTILKNFEDPLEEKKFVITINLQRRHLNEFQKSELGGELLKVEKTLSKQRESTAGSRHLTVPQKGEAVEKTAEQLGLSPKTFERAQKIIEKGSEELKDLVRNQTLSIYGGFRLVQALTGVPEKTKKKLEEQVVDSGKPDEELMKVVDMIAETTAAKSLLEMTSTEVAKEIEPKYKNLYYTEQLKSDDVKHAIQVAEGVQSKLKKVYVPWKQFESEADPEAAAEKYFKKYGGRFTEKIVIEMAVGEVDPYRWKERNEED